MKGSKDMIKGKVYDTIGSGRAVVVRYINSKEVIILFEETGCERTCQSSHLRAGTVKDPLKPSVYGVGFIGCGQYKPTGNNKKTPEYRAWTGMLERCYSDKSIEVNPTYAGCTVCDEWHNFQYFAEWFCARYKDGYELDKDIKISGNKTYSPETCLLVSKIENVVEARAKRYTFKTPKNKRRVVVRNLSDFCRRLGLHNSAMSRVANGKRHQHKGWTI
ncbi:winged helix-turn-helix DNA-binding domain protein [Vibrio phage 1.082.O._10N.261.49.E4]|nr:winged helix-turn-helix DNA-binding domain protein [Vibrio phage 1.082.O._10N.261.49.E4]